MFASTSMGLVKSQIGGEAGGWWERNSWRIALRLAELPNHFRMKSFSENKENEVGSEKRFW